MDKDLFTSLEERKADFASRNHVSEGIDVHLVLNTGRQYLVDRVVEVTDARVQIDGHDLADQNVPLSIIVPFHQINYVQFVKQKQRMRSAGFIG